VPEILIAVFVVLFGLAFGSFLNVCISRLPRHESLVHPRSRCLRCGAMIRALDNIPILSWIVLRARCRHCHQPIAWRYPAVEFAMAALFLLCYLRFALTIAGIGCAVLCFLLLGLAVMDTETLRLPDAFILPGIALGITFAGLSAAMPDRTGFSDDLVSSLPRLVVYACIRAIVWAALAALFLLLIRWLFFAIRHKEGLGMGDVKLFAMIAAWLGPAPAVLTLLLGALATAVYGILTVALSRGARPLRSTRLPLGSFLCAAALYTIFAGDPIIAWYLHFYGISR
jgi:leader peptidase (prepilin peptidase)/N-methyltransferase